MSTNKTVVKGHELVLEKGDSITHFTTVEGGYWSEMPTEVCNLLDVQARAHSFRTANGHRWDEINGWTS